MLTSCCRAHSCRHGGMAFCSRPAACPRAALARAAGILLMLLLAAQPTGATILEPIDAPTLLAFKGSFTNGEEVLWSWVGDDCCSGWEGVVCNTGGRVVKV